MDGGIAEHGSGRRAARSPSPWPRPRGGAPHQRDRPNGDGRRASPDRSRGWRQTPGISPLELVGSASSSSSSPSRRSNLPRTVVTIMCLAERRMSVWAGSIFQVLAAVASGQVVGDAMVPRWVPSIRSGQRRMTGLRITVLLAFWVGLVPLTIGLAILAFVARRRLGQGSAHG